MANYPIEEASNTLEHDPPAKLIDFAVQELNSDQALAFTADEWEQLGSERPRLREYISRVTFDIAPHDLELRERVARAILGYSVVLHETELVLDLEALLEAEPEEGITIPND